MRPGSITFAMVRRFAVDVLLGPATGFVVGAAWVAAVVGFSFLSSTVDIWEVLAGAFFLLPGIALGGAWGLVLGAPIGPAAALIYRLPVPLTARQIGAAAAAFAIAFFILPDCPLCGSSSPFDGSFADWLDRALVWRLAPSLIAAAAAWWIGGRRHGEPGRAPFGLGFLRGREKHIAWITIAVAVAAVTTYQVLPLVGDAVDPVAPPVVGGTYDWHGFYLSDVVIANGVHARLRYVDGRFPGTDISAGRDWEHIVGLAPSGDKVIVDDSMGHAYVVGPTGPELLLSDDLRLWQWRTDTLAVGCTSSSDCYQVNPRDGQRRVTPGTIPDERYSGETSPDGRWNATWRCGSTGGCDIYVADAANGRETRIAHGGPGTEWLPDGRLIYPIEGGLQAVRLGLPNPDGSILRVPTTEEFIAVPHLRGLKAAPRANVVATVTDEPNRSLGIWTIRLGESPRPVRGYDLPLRGNRTLVLTAVSADGRYVAFEQGTNDIPRAGVRDLVTGAVEFACESLCKDLFIY